ncbi:glycosyltransferase [Microbacterium lushaniae]|nr:glycosyltransferase [Microbacterium lushaniae]KAA9152707.1 glycosyltransferase [Microbacterium lushaniae]
MTVTDDVIDILLPYFGDLDYLRLAVESVRAQTDGAWRLVCVDDASPSMEGHEWIASLGDPRIVAVRNEVNLGVARNFARCLELSTADWFVMMGADDVMMPNYLETVRRATLRAPAADVIQPGVEVIDDDGIPARPLPDRVKSLLRPSTRSGDRVLAGEAFAASLARADWAYFPSLLWRRVSVSAQGFDASYDVALDLALLLDVAMAGGVLRVTDEVCFQYRRHARSFSQATATSGLRFEQERRFFQHYSELLHARGWHRASRIARQRLVSRLNAGAEMTAALVRGRIRDAGRLIRYVFR